jgi:hypothetical protein
MSFDLIELARTMILCPVCGNKRCPNATDRALACTGSNEPDQPGSIYTTPPFNMDTQQSTPTEGLQVFTEQDFQRLSEKAGGSCQFEACNYAHALRIAQQAYQMGADACCQWLLKAERRQNRLFVVGGAAKRLRKDRRPKPPTLKEQALAVLDDCNLDAAHENTLRRALEELPE